MSHFCTIVLCESPDDVGRLLAPYQENNMDDCLKEYLEFVEDEDYDIDEETGKRGYWENPNAKWDWWTIGGRWAGHFNTKDGETSDVVQIKDMDLTPDQGLIDLANREWEVFVEGSEQRDGEDFFTMYKKEYYINNWGTKEKYVEEMSNPAPWAFVTPDGVWHEKGEMGWFALDDATKESREQFLKDWEKTIAELPPTYYAVTVDCHI